MTRDANLANAPASPEDRIAALLPLYVCGRLEDTERRDVERWLETADAAQTALSHARDEQAAVIAANEMIAPPAGALAKLNAAIDGLAARPVATPLLAGLWQKLSGLLDFGDRRLAWAATAVLVMVVGVQASYIARQPGSGTYTTASGPAQPGAAAATATIIFRPEATVAAISEHLAANGAHIVSGPRGRVAYGIALDDEHPGGTRAERLERLKANTEIVLMFTPVEAQK